MKIKAIIKYIKAGSVIYISMLALLAIGGFDLLRSIEDYVKSSIVGVPAYQDMILNMHEMIYRKILVFVIVALVLSVLSALKIGKFFANGENK